jgi:hypothetical protein
MKKRKKDNILFVAQDAGGFNAIAPVIAQFKKEKLFAINLLFVGVSHTLARKKRWQHIFLRALHEERIQKIIQTIKPSVVVTGTSGGLSVEKFAIKYSKKASIPTVAILDFWINYNIRFSFDGSTRLHPNALPDFIFIIDEYAKKEMIQKGFPKEKLVITGNPHFDTYESISYPKIKTRRLLFVDQPFSELIRAGWHEDFGYTEVQVFQDLIEKLMTLSEKIEVVIKLHPRINSREKYKALIDQYNLPHNLNVSFAKRNESPLQVLRRTHAVFGMTSILLFEAALGGRNVISYQPHLIKRDPLISNQLGLTKLITKKNNIARAVRNGLFKQSHMYQKKRIAQYTKKNATGKVVNLIKKLALHPRTKLK